MINIRHLFFILITFLMLLPGLSFASNYCIDKTKEIASTDNCSAKSEKKKRRSRWSGEVKLGGSFNTGNVYNSNLSGRLGITYRNQPWRNRFRVRGRLGASKGVVNAEQISVTNNLRHYIREKDYLFNKLGFSGDRFGTYEFIVYDLIGYGRRLICTERTVLEADVGVGSRHSQINGTTMTRHEFIVGVGGHYHYKITKDSEFKQDITVLLGSPNIYTRSVSAVESKIVNDLSLQLSFEVENNTDVPPQSSNQRNTDTSTNISLIYKFK